MRSLKKVDWDSEAEANKDVSPSMESLTKDTVTMHKVINKYLSEIQVRMIMGPVFESYREQVGKVIKEAPVKTAAGKARLLREAKLFDAKLGPIDGAGNVGSHLIGLVVSKTVAEPKPESKEIESKQEEEETVKPSTEKKANGDTT